MTKEEILAMKAGSRLDKLIAEVIYDFEVIPLSGYLVCRKGKEVQCNLHPYSTDISSACQVIEKLSGAWDIKRRFGPHPDDPPMSRGRPTYQAAVHLVDADEFEHLHINERVGKSPWCWQLPEAICKAALLTKLAAAEIL